MIALPQINESGTSSKNSSQSSDFTESSTGSVEFRKNKDSQDESKSNSLSNSHYTDEEYDTVAVGDGALDFGKFFM